MPQLGCGFQAKGQTVSHEVGKMRIRGVVLVGLAAMFVLAGCGGLFGRSQAKPQKVVIAMGYIPNVQFAPVYVAIEKGYFAQEGLDVQLDYGMETDLLQRVGTNQLQFALASGDQVILARGNGLPVQYVFEWYRRFPVCVVSLADKGITDPKQLVGKTVGTPVLFGASYIGWLAFLDEVGIVPQDVNLQVIGYTQVASLTEGRVDAAICYALNEPIQLVNSGYKINAFYLDRYTKLVSNGLITNDETIQKNPKLVQGVVRAFRHGLQDTLADPDSAFAATRKAIPEMDETTAKLQRAVLQAAIAYWQGEPLGANQPDAWAESVSFMKKAGLLSTDVKPETLYTDRFVK
jgi:NitT/TauT family transport system substrate-binding protein